jgi:hypothetical protein
MLGASALPQGTTRAISLDRADALTAISAAVSTPGRGSVSFMMQQTSVADTPIAATCRLKSGRVARGNLASLKAPRAIACRFSEAGRWLQVRLDLQLYEDRGPGGHGSTVMRGELRYDGQRVAVSPLAGGSKSDAAEANRYLFTMHETPAASVDIGDKASVRVTQGIDGSALRAIILAATAMTVLSSPAG